MRIRRRPWARPELEECDFFVDNPTENKNKWKQKFKNSAPIHLELGAGKGTFISKLASENLDINYIAIDIKSDVLGIAKRNVEQIYNSEGLKTENILLTAYNIEQILDIFGEEDEIERIYINFCNPWPKPRHNKRRITHPTKLEKYKVFLKKGAEIHFKTDDYNLFTSTKKYFSQCGFEIIKTSEDLEKENIKNILTEHEKMFMAQGIKIKYIVAKNVIN